MADARFRATFHHESLKTCRKHADDVTTILNDLQRMVNVDLVHDFMIANPDDTNDPPPSHSQSGLNQFSYGSKQVKDFHRRTKIYLKERSSAFNTLVQRILEKYLMQCEVFKVLYASLDNPLSD